MTKCVEIHSRSLMLYFTFGYVLNFEIDCEMLISRKLINEDKEQYIIPSLKKNPNEVGNYMQVNAPIQMLMIFCLIVVKENLYFL